MFKKIDTCQTLSRKEFKKQLPELRETLLGLQQQLRDADFPVIILFSGVDGAGKHETVNALNEWMDPRWIVSRAYDTPSDEEALRPAYWRYWRDLPPKGQIGLFQSTWYSQPLVSHVWGQISDQQFQEHINEISRFEQLLADDGTLIIKFWLHLDKGAQKKHFRKLESSPVDAWQVTPQDWANWAQYKKFCKSGAEMISATHTDKTPWVLVDGYQHEFRSIKVAETIVEKLTARLAAGKEKQTAKEPLPKNEKRLQKLAQPKPLKASEYKKQLKHYQAELAELHRKAVSQGRSLVLAFEGWDAAGKGGAIRRLIHPMQAANYRVIPVAAPTKEEFSQHYLWRFWKHLPRAGKVSIFDRSWYGRVLVERIEGFCTEAEWRRAYREMNDFESQLSASGAIVIKFWLHITNEEQLTRFNDRAKIAHKAWKLTDEDWRNRDRWDDYELAVEHLLSATDTEYAPWELVAANDKSSARLQVLEATCRELKKALD